MESALRNLFKSFVFCAGFLAALASSSFAISYDAGGGGGGGGDGESFANISESGSTVTITGTLSIGGASQIVSTDTAINVYVGTTSLAVRISTSMFSWEFQTVTESTSCSNSSVDCYIPGIGYPVLSGSTYYFEADYYYVTAATNTGVCVMFDGPAGSTITYQGQTPQGAAEGTDNFYQGDAVSFGENMCSANVRTNNGPFPQNWKVWGRLVAGDNGTLSGQYSTETNGSSVTILPQSLFRYWKVP